MLLMKYLARVMKGFCCASWKISFQKANFSLSVQLLEKSTINCSSYNQAYVNQTIIILPFRNLTIKQGKASNQIKYLWSRLCNQICPPPLFSGIADCVTTYKTQMGWPNIEYRTRQTRLKNNSKEIPSTSSLSCKDIISNSELASLHNLGSSIIHY